MNGSCQLRVDVNAAFKAPTNGVCVDDVFSVTGSVTVRQLSLCGTISRPRKDIHKNIPYIYIYNIIYIILYILYYIYYIIYSIIYIILYIHIDIQLNASLIICFSVFLLRKFRGH